MLKLRRRLASTPPVVSPGVNTRVSIVVEGVRYGGRVDDVEDDVRQECRQRSQPLRAVGSYERWTGRSRADGELLARALGALDSAWVR